MEEPEGSYKGKKIQVKQEGNSHKLYINGNEIHHVERGGRFWTRNSPYRDYSSLNELAKSVIDHSERIERETKQT
jgi:hypothetical protein